MEFSTVFLILPLVVLSFHARTAVSAEGLLSCVQCNSAYDDRCKDKPEEFQKPCPENSSYCRIIQQWVDFKVVKLQPSTRIIRQCGFANDTEGASSCYYKAGYGGRVNVCKCSDNNCNGSVGVGPRLAVVVVMITLAKIAMSL